MEQIKDIRDVPFREWFEAMVEPLKKTAANMIAEGDDLEPLLLVFGYERDQVQMIPLSDTPMQVAKQLQASLSSNTELVCGVMLVSEAWTVVTKELPKDVTSLEHVPGRTETIIIHGKRGDEEYLAYCPITRPEGDSKAGSTVGDPTVIDLQTTPNMAQGGHLPTLH